MCLFWQSDFFPSDKFLHIFTHRGRITDYFETSTGSHSPVANPSEAGKFPWYQI